MEKTQINNTLQLARHTLKEGGYTCVMLSDGEQHTSNDRGVKPLLDFLNSDKTFTGATAADKTVGAGAAHLYVLLKVKSLWANVISESALKILENNNIEIHYGELVPYIINRKGDGVCPIEAAVKDAKTSKEAYKLIIETLSKLQKSK